MEPTNKVEILAPTEPAEERTCRRCNQTKTVSPTTWVYRADRKRMYGVYGQVCLLCERLRHKEYMERTKLIEKEEKEKTQLALQDPKKLKVISKMDVASALKTGSRVLNDYAPAVMARLVEYLEDPESAHHLWAMELLASRILPKKLYEEIGGQAAGVGTIADKRPTFVLNILPASAPGSDGQVIDISAETPALEDNSGEENDAG